MRKHLGPRLLFSLRPRGARWIALNAILSLLAFSAQAAAQENEKAFSFCAAPYPPPCVKKAKKGLADSACDERVRAYVQSVFSYRECLTAEMERAVRESNDVIDRWRCAQSGERCREESLNLK